MGSVSIPQLIEDAVGAATGARNIRCASTVQSLWSGYGSIVRLTLEGGTYPSVIAKHIKLPETGRHPRGWNTGHSHHRKIRSYQVEANWYQHYAKRCHKSCPVPDCLSVTTVAGETVLVLTDLDAAGFDVRKEAVTMSDIRACLSWLASFHATFMHSPALGLWESGGYWHLDTRPDELAALSDSSLKQAAPLIDQQLKACRYQTILHGDAKLANFCFTGDSANPKVAAVDFQYAGQGCGIKDVAYFIGSCVAEDDCQAMEISLLDCYFSKLRQQLTLQQPTLDSHLLEAEWRGLYDVAWADFHRFLKGWSPDHWKINRYSEQLTQRVIERLQL